MDNKRRFWEEHHEKKQMIYPSEEIVRFLNYWFPNPNSCKNKRALDMGAGSGRHTVLLSRMSFDTFALDHSFNAMKNTKSFLLENGLSGELLCATLDKLPFKNETFDIVVPWECIFIGDRDFVNEALSETHRILKNEGLCFTCFRTSKDSHIENVEKLSPGVYHCKGEWEGLTVTVLERNEVKNLLEPYFKIIWFDEQWTTRRNGEQKEALWIILAQKR
ncbi:MAG: class I SAM-dependent methyltransferase [bacterium]